MRTIISCACAWVAVLWSPVSGAGNDRGNPGQARTYDVVELQPDEVGAHLRALSINMPALNPLSVHLDANQFCVGVICTSTLNREFNEAQLRGIGAFVRDVHSNKVWIITDRAIQDQAVAPGYDVVGAFRVGPDRVRVTYRDTRVSNRNERYWYADVEFADAAVGALAPWGPIDGLARVIDLQTLDVGWSWGEEDGGILHMRNARGANAEIMIHPGEEPAGGYLTIVPVGRCIGIDDGESAVMCGTRIPGQRWRPAFCIDPSADSGIRWEITVDLLMKVLRELPLNVTPTTSHRDSAEMVLIVETESDNQENSSMHALTVNTTSGVVSSHRRTVGLRSLSVIPQCLDGRGSYLVKQPLSLWIEFDGATWTAVADSGVNVPGWIVGVLNGTRPLVSTQSKVYSIDVRDGVVDDRDEHDSHLIWIDQ